MKVRKVQLQQEQRDKEEAFQNMTPLERLAIHEELKRRIWGDLYNTQSFEGQKVKISKR